jgi:cytochrome c-type biogenesis protein CcmH
MPDLLRQLLALAGVLFVVALCFARPALAQTPDPSDEVHDIAKQLNCPTCSGRNLADCPTDTCMQWKDEIRTQIQQGKSAQEVIDYFEARFGPSVLQEPPKQGALLVVWALPVLGLAALAAGAVAVLRRISGPRVAGTGAAQAPQAEMDDQYVARLEEELRQDGR